MNSIVVCVEFDDFLALTLPRNKRHFGRTLVVTSCADVSTQKLALENSCECFVTDSFYEHGAMFNKGLALEKGLDVLGREGWICIWDADIVMPNSIEFDKSKECLYTALRRTLDFPQDFSDDLDWETVPVTGLECEYPGYFQLFHASAARQKPWYETDWTHAGGCDGSFQHRFKRLARPPFNVLHLGPSVDEAPLFHLRIGNNWCGRTTPRLDGKPLSPDARLHQVASISESRRVGCGTMNEKLK
jgi:hypothetical protein